MYSIYLVTNLVNNKIYVGQTKQGVEKRWLAHVKKSRNGSQLYFHRSISKYGVDQFDRHTVAEGLDRTSADNLEKLWIVLLGTHDREFGYNSTFGGEGVHHTPDSLTKLSVSHLGQPAWNRGRPWSDEARKKMSESKKKWFKENPHPNLGKKAKPESIEKSRLGNLGKKASQETKQKHSDAMLTAWRDPTYRAKLTENNQNQWNDPEYREKTIAAQKLGHQRPGVKQAKSLRSRELWSNPEYRERMLASRQKARISVSP